MSMNFDDDANDTKRQKKRIHSVEITGIYSYCFDKDFPECNVLENKATNYLISRNIVIGESKFWVFLQCGVVCSVNLNYA